MPPPPPPVSSNPAKINVEPEPIYEAISANKLTKIRSVQNECDMLQECEILTENGKESSRTSSPVLVKYEIDGEREQRRRQRVEKNSPAKLL